eukprot:1929111-Amphidinium_carterae.2
MPCNSGLQLHCNGHVRHLYCIDLAAPTSVTVLWLIGPSQNVDLALLCWGGSCKVGAMWCVCEDVDVADGVVVDFDVVDIEVW